MSSFGGGGVVPASLFGEGRGDTELLERVPQQLVVPTCGGKLAGRPSGALHLHLDLLFLFARSL